MRPLRNPGAGTAALVLLHMGGSACGRPGQADGSEFMALPEWKVAGEPSLIIGDDTAPSTQFLQVIPMKLGDGAILAADIGSRELRLFHGKSFVARLSRAGRGPGELPERFLPAVEGDTIYAVTPLNGDPVVRVYTPGAGFLRQFRLHRRDAFPRFVVLGRLAGGTYFVEEGPGFRPLSAPPPAGQVVPDSVSLGLLQAAPDGSVRSYMPLGSFQRGVLVPHAWPGGLMPRALSRSPYAIGVRWAVAEDHVWIADATTGGLRRFDATGAMVWAGTLPVRRRRFDVAELNEAKSQALRSATDAYQRAVLEAIHDPEMRPALVPIFDEASPGHDGELWIRRFEVAPGKTRAYVVIGRTGAAVATVHLPADVSVHHVGRDYVLGVHRNADGVETIVEYRLDRVN